MRDAATPMDIGDPSTSDDMTGYGLPAVALASRPALEVVGVSVTYGRAISALHDVSLTVPEHGVAVLVGRNGAGKTSMLRAISGLLGHHGGTVTTGRIELFGEVLDGRTAPERVTAGIAQVMEGRRIFAELTVEENLRLGGYTHRHDRRRLAELHESVLDLFPVLAQRRNAVAGCLSGGEQQMLALGSAMLADPKLLLLDEPSLGLAPMVVDVISDAIRRISQAGTPVLLVEQNAGMAMKLADHVYVLDNGSLVAETTSGDVETLRQIYLGGDGVATSSGGAGVGSKPASAATSADDVRGGTRPALEVAGLSLSFGGVRALIDISFTVGRGETLAVIGPNGAGKSSLLNCLAGTYRPQSGSARYEGHELVGTRPAAIVGRGIARTFQNLGVIGPLSVLDNVLLGRHRHIRGGFVASALGWPAIQREERLGREWAEGLLRTLGLFEQRHVPVASLPYGLQKRVDLARALAAAPSLLILDEPVAGMSTNERLEIGGLLRDLRVTARDASLSIILIEHDVELVMGLADRVMVLDFGRVIATGSPAVVREDPEVQRAYLGTGATGAAATQDAT